MKYAIVVMAMLVLACSSAYEPEVAADGNGLGSDGKVTVQYLVCGTCEFVDMAFCSATGPMDTIPAAILPVLMEFELAPGTEAFIRANKHDEGVVTVLVIANGFVNATDTALEGEHTAEARVEVW